MWGREAVHFELDTDVGPSPAWKPLPVLFTLPLSLAGDAAPELWLWVARSASLLAVVLAFRLAARFGGRPAGAVAAAALLLVDQWLRGAAHGYSEGVVVALILGAVELHLAGHRRRALAALLLAALARPEALPFLVVYARMLARREPGTQLALPGALVVFALLWVGVDWVGSGELLHGTGTAAAAAGDLAWYELLLAGAALVGVPVLLLGAIAGGMAWRRGERTVLALAGCAAAWTVLVCALVAVGYPPSSRFLVPAAALLCVLAGVGSARLVRCAGVARALRMFAAAVLLCAAAPFVVWRAGASGEALAVTAQRAVFQEDLQRVARRAGAGAPYAVPEDLAWAEGAVAWELEVPLGEIGELRRVDSPPLDGQPILRFDGGRPRERLFSAASRRAASLIYLLPEEPADALTVFVPVHSRPVTSASGHLRARLLARTSRWTAWTISWGSPT